MINVYIIIIYCIILFFGLQTVVFAEEKGEFKDEFVMSWKSSPTSLDPQYQALSPNKAFASHIFDTLYYFDWASELQTDIIKSVQNPDNVTWIFELKSGIFFHDGSELNSDDVIYTLERLSKQPSPDRAILSFLGEISYRKIDQYFFQIVTAQPRPGLPQNLVNLHILKKQKNGFADTKDFNSGLALIGTGPYRFIKKNEKTGLHLEAFDNYHGNQPYLRKINIRYSKNSGQRLEEFIAGEVDLLDKISPEEADQLKLAEGKRHFNQVHLQGDRLFYLYLDQFRNESPHIHTYGERRLSENPLRKVKVRQALSHAIDREYLVKEILGGRGTATGQFVSEGRIGFNPSFKVDEHNTELALKLLEEAGYRGGFKLTLHGPNDRYIKDEQVLTAIAKMWSAIGIDATAVAKPKAQYFPEASALQFSIGMTGNNTFGVIDNMLKNLLYSFDQEKRIGIFNRGRYSSSAVDDLLEKGLSSFDPGIRYRNFRIAAEVALTEQAIIPLYIENYSWAIRGDMVYRPRSKEMVEAYAVFPATE